VQRRAGVIKTEEQAVFLKCQEIRLRLFFIFIIYRVINFSLNTTAHLKKKKNFLLFCHDCTFIAGCETFKYFSLGADQVGKHLTETTAFGGDI
jgi:hypothetical protein